MKSLLRPRCIFVCGPPGAGKTTVCTSLAAKREITRAQIEGTLLGFQCSTIVMNLFSNAAKNFPKTQVTHLNVGDALRTASGPNKKVIEDCLKQGDVVPLNIIAELLQEKFRATNDGFTKTVLLDGFPRQPKQLEMFQANFSEPSVLLWLNASSDTIHARLKKRGRDDDMSPDVIAKRISVWDKSRNYMEEQCGKKFWEIDANGKPEQVLSTVRNCVQLCLAEEILSQSGLQGDTPILSAVDMARANKLLLSMYS